MGREERILPAGLPVPPDDLVAEAVSGGRGALARLLSLVERGGEPARQVGRLVFPLGGRAYVVGLTGAPGAGKSTLGARLIVHVRGIGSQVAVLAVDPTSPLSGGALLGDRIRMQDQALDPGVFIRSMATRGHLGGLALAVPEAIRVLDAAGIDLVLVETVGVGQVEVEVAGAADTTVVVLTPGAGDSIQASKAGLLEIADVFVINKADRAGTRELRRDLETMLELSAPEGWTPPIVEAVATTGQGVEEAWEAVARHRAFLERDGELGRRRAARLEGELRSILGRLLEQRARQLVSEPELAPVLQDLVERRLHPHQAAAVVLDRMGR